MMILKRAAALLAAALLCAFVPTMASAETATLIWTHPTQYTDGSALSLTDIASTVARCSGLIVAGKRVDCSTTFLSPPPVLAPATTLQWGWTAVASKGGQVCFQVQTIMASGVTSDWSNEVCTAVRPAAPVLVLK